MSPQSLIDPKKKEIVLQRIKDGKSPFCAEKPAPEPAQTPKAEKTKKKGKPEKESDFYGLRMPMGFHMVEAAKRGDCDMIRRLLDENIDIEWMDGDRSTPLMYAAREGKVKALELLISRGADLSKVDGFNMTALGWAKHGSSAFHDECVKILKKHGAMG